MKKPVTLIYTDGGCVNNPGGIGAYAAIIFENKNPMFLSGYEPTTTNQRMELTAVIKALEYVRIPTDIKVYSDSAYVCNCFKYHWYSKWVENKWKNSKGEPVANRDLWERLLKLVVFHKSVLFNRVAGHSTNIFNNKCDELCTDMMAFGKNITELIENKED